MIRLSVEVKIARGESRACGPLRRAPLSAKISGAVLAIGIAAASHEVKAQVVTDISRAPALTIERYSEDWSYLADPASRTGRWTEPFKYIPLSQDGSTYLTTGLEIRSRFEGFDNPDWGATRDDGYIWHRFMPYADLHLGKIRLFTQPIFSKISGGDLPLRPIDTTGADMLQAFAEVEVPIADQTSLRISGGRKLMSFGAARFIDNRYGPGVLQAFEGVETVLADESRQISAFHVRPVDTAPEDFDDRASHRQKLWGVYATQWLGAGKSTGIDAFYLGLRERESVIDQGVGRQVVHTFGGRYFGDTGAWYWNFEGAIQSGTFAGHRLTAWGGGGEVAYRFLETPLRPELQLGADIISGDEDRHDSTVQTFNPLFPNGKYFGSLTPVGPRNMIHVRPTVTIHPHKDVAVSLVGVAFWRQSLDDGIYAISGGLVRSGEGSDARFIGKQIELTVSWQMTPELNFTGSLSAFEPGQFIRDTGPANRIHMASATVNFRF